jgi:poly(3-hydroxybutyrate) depolymerase
MLAIIIIIIIVVLLVAIRDQSHTHQFMFAKTTRPTPDLVLNDGVYNNVPLYTYTPQNYTPGAPILFIIHGASKNAWDYRDYGKKIADDMGVMIVAPLLQAKKYSTGGLPGGKWTFDNFTTLVDRVLNHFQANSWWFMGHSGGAQFVSRYCSYTKCTADKTVACNAGTYAFPDAAVAWPYGMGNVKDAPVRIQDLLATKILIALGEADTKADAEAGVMDQSPEANTQGLYRLARGRAYFAACQHVANENNFKFNMEKRIVPGVGHSADKMFNSPQVTSYLSE